MRTFLVFLLICPAVYAAPCRDDQKLSNVGTLQTASAVISASAAEVRAISVLCGGSACTAGLYDSTTLGGATTSTARLEIGADANTPVFFPNTGYLEQPLAFTSGVTFVDDGNVASVTVYACTDR